MAFGKGKKNKDGQPVIELDEQDVVERDAGSPPVVAGASEDAGRQDAAGDTAAGQPAGKPAVPGGEGNFAVSRGALMARPPRKKPKVGRIVLIVIAVAVAGLFLFNTVMGMLKGPTPTFVETSAAAIGDVQQTLSTTGVITTGEKVTVFCPVNAPLENVKVELGGLVNKGDTIFTFNVAPLEQAYRTAAGNSSLTALQRQDALNKSAKAAAEQAEAQASVDNVKIQEGIAQERVDTLAPQLAEAQASAEAEKAILNGLETEYSGLVAAGSPAEVLQRTQRKIDHQRNKVKRCEERLASLSSQLSVAQQDVTYQSGLREQMAAARDTAGQAVLDDVGRQQLNAQQVPNEVALETAMLDLEKGRNGVQAPISGVITGLEGAEGGMVSQYAPLCTIESLSKVNVVVSLSRYDLERVREGQAAVMKHMGKEYTGTVTKINSMATQEVDASGTTSGYINATISLAQPDQDIRLGIEANVELNTGAATGVVMVPISAVNTDVNGAYCYVMENNMAKRREIVTGISNESVVEITEGISEGDEVILSSQNLLPDMLVSTDPAYQTAPTLMDNVMIG